VGRLLVIIPLLALLAGLTSAPAAADKRVALVVGNSAYRNVTPLDNPGNDAKLIADTLRGLGFTLVGGGAQLDLDKPAFDRAVLSFGEQLSGADVGLFYYAGHGLQVRDANYLVPIDANPTKEADVDFQMLDTNLVLRQMEAARTQLNIVILDACRNNPFSGRSLAVAGGRMRDASSGLAEMQVPSGTLISFATQPKSVAQDGSDGHSPYSRALADTIRRPGLGIFDVFNQVGLEVKRSTGGVQQPWVSNSPIEGVFYFAPPGGAPAVALSSPGPASPAMLEQDAARGQSGRIQLAALPPAALPTAPLPVPPTKLLTPEDAKTLKAGDAFKECDRCPVMVAVPPGSFLMGSPASEKGREPAEDPQQPIVIGKMFAVGRSEVSFDEWSACVTDGGCNRYRPDDNDWGKGKLPVINVSWADAQAYVKWLSEKTGASYRLLSEAEREYVARGCTTISSCPSSPFWFGADISRDHANYDSRFTYAGSPNKAQARLRTVETDASEANPFGLLHVHGNVSEWVEDCWNASLKDQPRDGSARSTGDCLSRVIRGGSWADRPQDLRSAKRAWEKADETGRSLKIGFRVARTLQN
jgi:formylglycine-generating enzyme required for sulfatase activity